MEEIFGFIGTGNMGGALARAAARTGARLILCNRTREKAEALARELNCETADARQVAASCGYLFLGVKPQMMGALLADLAPILRERETPCVLISMAAGLTMASIRRMAGGDYPVIRMMPNTPVAVGSGVILYDATGDVAPEALEAFCGAMSQAGYLDRLPEKLMDAGCAVSGCGPAFVSMFIEALAEGGVACGLDRQTALGYAAYTLAGTARLLLETGKTPGQLTGEVCSPGGATIEGVKALEQGDLRSAVMQAVKRSFLRTRQLADS